MCIFMHVRACVRACSYVYERIDVCILGGWAKVDVPSLITLHLIYIEAQSLICT